MVSVPYQPVPSVSPSVGPDPSFRIQASPEAFGAGVGAAQQRLGQAFSVAGAIAGHEAVQFQEQHNEVAETDAFNRYHGITNDLTFGNPNDPGDRGHYGLHGADAVNAEPHVIKRMEEERTKIKNGLQNQAQMLRFDVASRRLTSDVTNRIRSHSMQEYERYAEEVYKSATDVKARDTANNWNNEDVFQHNLADELRLAERRAMRERGADPSTEDGRAIIASYREKAEQTQYLARATGMGNVDPAAAYQFVQKNIGKFDPLSGDHLLNKYKAKYEGAADDAYVNGLLGGVSSGSMHSALRAQEGSGPDSVSKKGARGQDQLTQGFFQTYARPGESFDRESDRVVVAQRGIDSLTQKYGGDPARVAVAYFSGESNVSPPGSAVPWVQNRSDGNMTVSQYVSGVTRRLGGGDSGPNGPLLGPLPGAGPQPTTARATAAGLRQPPDKSAIVQQIIRENPDPERQQRRLSKFSNAMNVWDMATETERTDLRNSLPDIRAALLDGRDVQIPEDAIRHLFEPAPAAREIEQLQVAKQAGQVLQGVKWGTPDQINAAHQSLVQYKDQASSMPLTVVGRPEGVVTPGNLDLNQRPIVKNRDGSVSTVRSLTVTDDAGHAVLIPSVIGNRVVSNDEAVKHYRATGEHLGIFDTNAHADAYAQSLHDQQAAYAEGKASDRQMPEAYRLRASVLSAFEERVEQRRKALNTDPAGYVQTEPGVAAAAANFQAAQGPEEKAAARQQYVNASLTAQTSLGVPDYQLSVIPKDQAGAIVGKLVSASPATMNVQQQLAGMAKDWGPAWPKAYGDLVRAKLPGGYQVLATMDRPEQAGASADLQNAMTLAATKGGVPQVAESVGRPDIVKEIDGGVGAALEDFRRTVAFSPGGMALYDHVEQATKLLSYSYAMRGQNSKTALTTAVDGILNAKYDFHGSWRSEKAVSDQAVAAANSVRRSLTVDDIAPIAGNPLLTDNERKQAVINSDMAWINSPDDSGIILTYPARGTRQPVIGRNGQPVQIKFNNIPSASRSAPIPGVMPPPLDLLH